MKNIAQFVKSTLVGGFFVVLPVVLIWLLLAETVDLVVGLVTPVAELLPVQELGGVEVARWVAISLLLVVSFLAGLAMRTKTGVSAGGWMERTILLRIPGYAVLKSLTRSFSGDESRSGFVPATFATAGESRMLGFIVEEHDNGDCTLFVPLAPTPGIGTVHIVPGDRLQKLDASAGGVFNCLWQFGVGSKDLLAERR